MLSQAKNFRRIMVGAFLSLLCVVLSAARAGAARESDPVLHFVGHDGVRVSLALSKLRDVCETIELEVNDPYHKRLMRYSALPVRCVLDVGFLNSGGAEGQRSRSLLLRALDGYTRTTSGRELLEPGGYLAFGEPERMNQAGQFRFSKIGRREVDPSPFYLIWSGLTQNDPHIYPWPYQLSTIEVTSFAQAFPRTVPEGLDSSDLGWAGYSLFQRSCASCHAINGEGGKIGPDLNVPRSIVEYRPVAQIRAYIRNPEATRYTNMPSHPNLTSSDLDALIAYFRAMSDRKDDPRAREGS